jgi:hypothetical protein
VIPRRYTSSIQFTAKPEGHGTSLKIPVHGGGAYV